MGSAEASFALELEGRAISERRIVAVISNLARSIAQLNVNGFLPGGLVSTLSSHVEVLFNGPNRLQTYA